ncbi:MAG TPA: glycosyltransferase [Thermoanaerobaculia bacterium]|nr:glycosyltransferase [Thermoanaerobaculia bacterium]
MNDQRKLDILVLGLSITSSWGNGHATTYRSLIRGLHGRGHRVRFLERERPWHATTRDLVRSPHCEVVVYEDLPALREHVQAVRDADLVLVGSYVPDGAEVAKWVLDTARGVTAFYDIDTPVTMSSLENGGCAYLQADQIPGFDLYLTFNGGPTLDRLHSEYGARQARPLYCSVDPDVYRPEPDGYPVWHLGYMGTYSDDRQPGLERLLLEPARRKPRGRFLVVGSKYPDGIVWPANTRRVDHLAPVKHSLFYNTQRFTLNLTRAAMCEAGWAPSVRLFEAAACATPVISDSWPGIDVFFDVGTEILLADDCEEVLRLLEEVSEEERRAIGERARRRVLAAHTAEHRAAELERFAMEARALQTAVA